MTDEEATARKYWELVTQVVEQTFGDFWEILREQMHPDDVALIQEHNVTTLEQLHAALEALAPENPTR